MTKADLFLWQDRQTRKFNMLTNLAPLGENDTEPKKDFGAHNLSIDCVDNRRQLQSGKQDSSKDKEFHNRVKKINVFDVTWKSLITMKFCMIINRAILMQRPKD